MLGPNANQVWPKSGETDIMESVADAPGTVFTNIHGVDQYGKMWESGWWGPNKSFDYAGSLADGFHQYSLDWRPNRMNFYFDGHLVRSVNPSDTPKWLWNKPFYLLLSLAVGRSAGSMSPDPEVFPVKMAIDYVRLYSN
jgi:beta-glucanase (GH16 family)